MLFYELKNSINKSNWELHGQSGMCWDTQSTVYRTKTEKKKVVTLRCQYSIWIYTNAHKNILFLFLLNVKCPQSLLGWGLWEDVNGKEAQINLNNAALQCGKCIKKNSANNLCIYVYLNIYLY